MAIKDDITYHNSGNVVDSYDHRITRSYQFEHKYITLEKWIKNIKRSGFENILDFGCGTGNSSFKLISYGFKPVSLDTSLGMLKEVSRKCKKRSLCINGDGEKLPFKDGAFDAVICMGVMHHLDNKPIAIREMIRVVKKGGSIYIAEPYVGKSLVMKIYNALIFFPRLLRNILKGLKTLETEHQITLTEFEEEIKKTSLDSGATVDEFYYLYPPLLFRFLSDTLGRVFFKFLNPHIKFKIVESVWGVSEYDHPKVRGNILEVHIKC